MPERASPTRTVPETKYLFKRAGSQTRRQPELYLRFKLPDGRPIERSLRTADKDAAWQAAADDIKKHKALMYQRRQARVARIVHGPWAPEFEPGLHTLSDGRTLIVAPNACAAGRHGQSGDRGWQTSCINRFTGVVPDRKDSDTREGFTETDMKLIRANLYKLDKADQLLLRVVASTGMDRGEAFSIDGERMENGIRYLRGRHQNRSPAAPHPVPKVLTSALGQKDQRSAVHRPQGQCL